MKPKKEMKRRRLDEGLCPEDFEICVPESCELLSDGKDWSEWENWREYVEGLTTTGELPAGYTEETAKCWTCDCKPGWKLTGELAITHACRVHEKIHRQALSLDLVSAIDVGFAIQERQKKFANFLAIRIHVRRKRAPEELIREGLSNFADPTTPVVYAGLYQLSQISPENGGEARVNALESLKKDPSNSLPVIDYLFQVEGDDPLDACKKGDRYKRFQEVLKAAALTNQIPFPPKPHPILGVRKEDLSIRCPRDLEELRSIKDLRLCICGVPIDVVNADYNPSVTHPGGDASSGVFVDPPKGSNRLSDEELRLIGRGRVNPLVGGISIGSVTGQAGTLGTVVWDRMDGTPCILSNWHVLAGSSSAERDQPTYQPALFDGGTRDDRVARLKRWTLGSEGDAAIAELDGRRHFASGEILGLWHPLSGTVSPRLGLKVRKWGRTTGFTQGFVDGIHLAINIDYGNNVVRYFDDQFHIAPLFAGEDVSRVGDSGSLVVTSFRPTEDRETIEAALRWLRTVGEPEQSEELFRILDENWELSAQPAPSDPDALTETSNSVDNSTAGDLKTKRGKRATDTQGEQEEEKKKIKEILIEALREIGLPTEKPTEWVSGELAKSFRDDKILEALESQLETYRDREFDTEVREAKRVYYAVGMIFAGDTPGSPFGEFAVASDISRLAEELRFSLRPVFEPRSSFRELRTRPPGRGSSGQRVRRSGRSLTPRGTTDDPRGEGPQPDLEPAGGDSGN